MFRNAGAPILLLSTIALVAAGPAPAQQPAASTSTSTTAADIAKSASPELVGLLTKELGITPKQAEGGAGAVFGYAKTKLKADDYAKVEKSVPGVDGLLKAAPKADTPETGSTGTLGALAGAASSQLGGTAGAAAALAPAFEKLGLKGETVGKFLPVVVGFVTKKGGASTGDPLGAVLK